MRRLPRTARSPLAALVVTVAAVAAVSAAIVVIDDFVPVLSLGVLYILAVLAVAVLRGSRYAVLAAVSSMLVFNFFFLPPYHTFHLSDGSNWFALAVYVVTAIAVGTLAAGVRKRAALAEQRERETALLADVGAELLGGADIDEATERVSERAAEVLGVPAARIELGAAAAAASGESAHELTSGSVRIGTLFIPAERAPSEETTRRLLPALGALLAVARDRERLAREAIETEALRRSDAVKTAVIRAMSHDLRTPLATIQAALDGLQDAGIALDERDRAALLESVRVEHARLKRLVENLLDLSRLQAGAAAPVAEVWPADELVDEAVTSLPGRGRVFVTRPEQAPNVRVDAVQIERVLANLLENALRYSPPDEPVTVALDTVAGELVIRVSDRGPGIPEAERERVFAPFHRLEGREHGAGLGLAIARGFAEANGGRLEIVPGRSGTTFVLSLPAVEAPVEVAG